LRASRVVAYLALALVAGCGRPAGPRFVVETWDGQRLVGVPRLQGETLHLDAHRLPRSEVRRITRLVEAAGLRERIEGFEPLAADQLARYRQRALEAARKHPGAESVLCLDHGQDTLTPDGRQLYRYHALTLVLKDKGRAVADLTLGFREGRSRVRVLFARSIAPDGRSRWLQPSDLKVSVPKQQAQFLDTRRRILSGRIPGVEVGSLVEYAYEYDYYNPDVPDYFFPNFYFQGTEPVLDSILDVRVPAGRRLNWVAPNMPPDAREPKRRRDGPYEVYRWELHDVPPIVPEPMMPAREDVVPSVQCSLFFDWKDLHERTGRYQRERIEVTPEIAALAKRLTKGAKTDDAKLAALYHWVQRNIRYLSIKASLSSGWAGHPASETLRNGYGDCTDKAILLASLAKAVGIRAYPAIIKTNTSGRAIVEIPIPDANHCINVAYPGGRRIFLDATASNYRYPYFRADDHGVKAIIHITGEILDVPVPPPQDNMRQSTQELWLQADGTIRAIERNAYTGTYEAVVRGFWRSVPPRLRGPMMQQYLQRRCPGAQCTGFRLGELEDLSKQLTMEIRYRVPQAATFSRDLYIVAPPGFERTFPEAALPSRKFAIERMTTQEFRTTIRVHPPEGYQPVGVPEPLVIHGKHLWYEGRVERAKDASLVIRERYRVLTRVVPPEDYADYRAQATRIAAWTRLKLVFRRKGRAG